MGKRLRQQRRGRGTPRYTSPGHRYLGAVTYQNLPQDVKEGRIVDIVHAPGRTTPAAVVDFSGTRAIVIAHEGAHAGQIIRTDTAGPGSIMQLKDIPEGSKVYNIELTPRDGGRLCRSSGTFATLVSKEDRTCTILLPSKQKKTLLLSCLATVGAASSSGRKEKPFRKAGKRYHVMRAFGRLYPRTSGVAMNPVDHPFGGQTRPGKPKTVSRHMPPGKKVGNISPRRTGRRKK